MRLTKDAVIKNLRNPRSVWQTALLVGVTGLAYLYRSSQYLLKPQLFAEDGVLWLAEGYHKNIFALAQPVNGFLHFPERLFGYLVARLPLHYAPLIFVLTAWGLFILLSYYLLSIRTKILTNNYERLFMVAALCLIANINELFFNFSNSVFLMGIIGILILLAEKPKNKVVAIAEKVFFLLSCLTLPFAWFYLPITLVERFKYKRRGKFFFYTSLFASITQIIYYSAFHVNRSHITLLSLFSKWTLLEIYNQMIIPAVRFARIDTDVNMYSLHHYEVFSVFLAVSALLIATIAVLRKSNKQVWYLLFFLVAMTFAAIKSPSLNANTPEEALKTMSMLHGGSRYFVYGILAVHIIFVKAAYQALAQHARYIFLVIFMSFGLLTSVHYQVFYIDKGFTDYTKQYRQGVDQFESGQSDKVNILVNPAPWNMTLERR